MPRATLMVEPLVFLAALLALCAWLGSGAAAAVLLAVWLIASLVWGCWRARS